MSSSTTYESDRAAAEQAEDKLSRAGSEFAGKLADTANGVQQDAKAQIDRQMDRLSGSIREKPLQSAAIAAGLGFLFAVVARR